MSIQEKPLTLPPRSPLLWYKGLKTEEEGELVAQQQQGHISPVPQVPETTVAYQCME